MDDTEQYCARCKEAKKASDFYASQGGAIRRSWCKACYRLHYAGRKVKVRWSRILRAYGISQADYERMFEIQGGVCDICKKPEGHTRFKFLAVDHDHKTGKIRGLLCHRCNGGLGNFDDTTALFREVIVYLEKHRAAPTAKIWDVNLITNVPPGAFEYGESLGSLI